jgi:iron complex outermembrane receptor protein
VTTPSALGSLWELVAAFSDLRSFRAACTETLNRDELDFTSEVFGAGDKLDTYGTSATFTWDLSESLTLKSIASWRRQELRGDLELDFTELQLGTQLREPQQQDQISAELQLSGRALDDRLDFTTGLYWFREKADKAETTLIATDIESRLPLNPAFAPIIAAITGSPLTAFALTTFPFSVGVVNASDFRSTKTANLSYAAYAQATYDVTDRLSLTGGIRFTHERREMDAFSRLIGTGRVRIPKQKVNDRFDAWTPMASISYRLTDNVMGYASWSRGFKSGGFNGRATSGGELESFDPEEIRNWEVGLKSSLFDRRLQLNFAAFYADYEDIQTTVTGVDPDNPAIFTAVIENASEATIKGLELEAIAQPMAGLHLTASFGLLDAEYDEWDDIDPNTGAVIDLSDRDFTGGANFTMNLAARYTFAFLKLGTMNARAEWAHAGRRFNDPANQDSLFAGKTGLLSARIALELNDGQTEIAIFGKNLLDRRYLANGINFEDIGGFVAGYYGPERTYGIEVRRDF